MTRQRGARWTWWGVAFVLAAVLNLVLLYWPRQVGGPSVVHLDKAVHLVSFAALAWTGLRAGLRRRWLLPLLALHAVASEVVQGVLLARRSGDGWDVVADLAGVVVGAVLAGAATRGRTEA